MNDTPDTPETASQVNSTLIMEYRREIDGLRALAVLPVILFHAGFKAFSGGFVGVDVFFVISGYLITTTILAEKQAGTFALVNFYERRARRILPALFVVMFACLPFAWQWLIPKDMWDFSKSLVAVAGFASNVYFWRTSGYFETAVDLKPLLHTWSLAVEEQYYLIFPVFIMLTWRLGNRWILALLSGIAIISLAAAQWGSVSKLDATFYSLPTRGWELLIGAFIPLYFSNEHEPQTSKIKSEIGGAIGLLMLVYAVFVFDKQTLFPGLYTLIPTIGTALIILFATQKTAIGKLLGNRLFVGIGLISYSAYLWHQPLFAFARHRSLYEPSKFIFGILAAFAIVLAYFSWKYVEKPFRSKQRFTRKQIFVYGTMCCFIFTSLGMAGHFYKGFTHRYSFFENITNIRTIEESRCFTTEKKTADQIAEGNICVLGNGETPTFAVIGDSHAGAIFEALEEYRNNSTISFAAFSYGWCPPLLNSFNGGGDDCINKTREAFNNIIESKSIVTVFLVAEWANYTKGYRDDERPQLFADSLGAAKNISENEIIFKRSLRKTIHTLLAAGKNIVIIEPVPEFNKPVLNYISKSMMIDNLNGVVKEVKSYAPTVSINEYETRNAEVLKTFSELSGVTFVKTKNIFCTHSLCSSVDEEGNILFSDTNHVTKFGAQLISQQMMRQAFRTQTE